MIYISKVLPNIKTIRAWMVYGENTCIHAPGWRLMYIEHNQYVVAIVILVILVIQAISTYDPGLLSCDPGILV